MSREWFLTFDIYTAPKPDVGHTEMFTLYTCTAPDPISPSQHSVSTQSNTNFMEHCEAVTTESHHDNYTSAFSDDELMLAHSEPTSL